MRAIRLIALLTALAASACSGDEGPPATPSAAALPTSTTLESVDCPVDDESFCAVAVEVGDALMASDVDRLLDLSRIDTIVCADVSAEYFPGCAQADTVVGHGVSDAGLLVTMLETAEYRDRLGTVVGAVDPTFTDEFGEGAVRLLGVGTCGPDVPGRRSYHLAWTAATRSGGEPRRLLASFEFTYADDWRIALWYLDTYESWVAAGQDPLGDAFCEAGRHPWRG